MNRRVVLAGLMLVALAALVVVLATSGSGGGGGSAEAIRGTPFSGDAGVTRSVASISAQQRYLDRHPEIEARRDRELAAEEAAREAAGGEDQAAEEQDEATDEEGETTEEQGETTEEQGQAAEEAGVAREQGERAAEESNIREKPEPPGEEGLP